MADYYPLIARAVTGLDKNTGEGRRALYERARTALVTQLRGVEPALSEADITRERLALEEAIRKVEGESARRPPRQESIELPRANLPPLPTYVAPPSPPPPPPPPPPPSPPPPPPVTIAEASPPPPPDWEELRRELDGLAPPPEPDRFQPAEQPMEATESPEPEPRAEEPPLPFDMGSRPEFPPEPEPEQEPEQERAPEPEREPEPEFPPPPEDKPFEPPSPPRRADKPPSWERPSLVDEGLKGFRDVVAEADDLGGASASASRSMRDMRQAYADLPSGEAPRLEPRHDPHFGRQQDPTPELEIPPPPPRPEPRAGARARPIPPRLMPEELEQPEEEHHVRVGGGMLPKIVALLAILVLLGAGYFAYREWGSSLTGMFQSARAPTTQTSKESPQARPKISDRIGGTQQDASRPPAGAGAAVAQRAVLYEQGATPQERKQYVGSVTWRTETAAPGPGQAPDLVVKAEIEIPERHIRASLTLRRNLDEQLPVSHTLEILFSTAADFQPGGVANLVDVLMQDANQSRAAGLKGTSVKVTNGFFLLGLSSNEIESRRNILLLKDGAWLLTRVTYNNGQSASLGLEKGIPGDRVINEALTAWGQMPPSAQPR